MGKVVSTTVTFGKYTDIAIKKLKKAGHTVLLNNEERYYTENELVALGNKHQDTEALIVGGDHITRKVIDAFPNLKIIAMHGVGVDKIDISYASNRKIVVTNTPGANSIDVAEYVISLMIDINRQLFLGIRDMKNGIWQKRVGRRVYGQMLGIIGVGSIGLELAKRAQAMGLDILGYDPYENEQAKKYGVSYVNCDDLLSNADIIALHAPVIKNAPPIINADSIKLVKKDAVIINAARAPLVDLDAVEDAIKQNLIGGFITDVYEVEPPKERDLWKHENVLMTPHGGGGTIQANINMGEMAVANVINILNGESPINPVNQFFTKK
ncbi:phosphoglycerate dehydrogenase [Enterococcus sp.]|uniref:phosphoglycerate dehydrogenase n=1 Tax=Enterococcus sp. TaxID=35783 RepID=UPI000ED27904|nr:phosphoglycerate dehydrogenase [Enterococcus sp.]HAB96456.1 phosphoglycerate dehydrogenase [Enterococcus sp.]